MQQVTQHELPNNEEQQRERAERWNAFVGKFLPATILEIFPPNALQDLLRGFFLKIRRGVTLLYAHRSDGDTWSFDNADRIDPYNVEHGINGEFLNPICFELRRSAEIQERCVRCDQYQAVLRSSEATPGPCSYPCWLGLIDLLYPVRLEGHIIAFVFAGQIPPDAPSELESVRARIAGIGGAKSEDLIRMLDEQVRHRSESGIAADQETQQTQEQLGTFVTAVELTMAALHASCKRTSEDDLLRYWETNLPAVDHTDEAEWWRRLAQLAEDFLKQLGMGRVTLFVRAGKNFDQRWPCAVGGSGQRPLRLASRDVLQAVQPEHLIQADDALIRQLAETVAPNCGDACFYRTRATSADAQPGLLFTVEGRPATQFTSLAEQFLGRISSRTEYAALTFQLKRMHEQYVQTVSDAAHDFRHPLQLLEFKLAELLALPLIKQDQARVNELHKIKLRLRQAQEQTLSLQKQEKDSMEVLNLVELLDEVIEYMTPRAAAHPCPITRHGNWPEAVPVKANRGHMFRIFLNLIDNAIKYSFMGPQYDVRIQVFPIDWSVNNGSVKVLIRNFGVGIPSDRVARILERGERAEVRDHRRQREGTGLGLAIVTRFLSEHGGTFEIESHPEPEDSARPMARNRAAAVTSGLRYVTTVTVRLKPARNA
jgi:signal transduction histidine kinase/ligand-binding sensor protein